MSHAWGHKKPRHCSDCGERIIEDIGDALTNCILLHALLSNGTVSPISFCEDCVVGREWTQADFDAMTAQMQEAWSLSCDGQMYVHRGNGWVIERIANPLPEDIREREKARYRTLRVVGMATDVAPVRLGGQRVIVAG